MLINLLTEAKKTAKPKVKVKIKHPGILEVPEGKSFEELPLSHYKKLVSKDGYSAISKALTNLEVWNRKKNPEMADKAKSIRVKLDKIYGPKSESTIQEDEFKIKIKHPGVLEVPEGKNFWELPLSHYKELVKQDGYDEISKALTNLEVWNRKKDPQIADKAKAIRLRLDSLYGEESK